MRFDRASGMNFLKDRRVAARSWTLGRREKGTRRRNREREMQSAVPEVSRHLSSSRFFSNFPRRFVTPPHLLCFSRFALGFSYGFLPARFAT